VVALLFTAGAAGAGAFIQGPDGELRWWALVIAAGLIIGAGALALAEKRSANRLELDLIAEQADVRVAINDLLEPLMQEFGRAMATSGRARARLFERLVPLGLTAAHSFLGGRRTRASFFRVRRNADDKWEFAPDQSQGRAGQPRTVFTLEDEPAIGMVLRLKEQGYDFCEDIEENPPEGFPGTGSGYRTYLSVLARNGDKIAGLVSVDSPDPGDLAPDDRHFLNVVATIISVAVHEAEAATPGE
jgi:hypothetical protein